MWYIWGLFGFGLILMALSLIIERLPGWLKWSEGKDSDKISYSIGAYAGAANTGFLFAFMGVILLIVGWVLRWPNH